MVSIMREIKIGPLLKMKYSEHKSNMLASDDSNHSIKNFFISIFII